MKNRLRAFWDDLTSTYWFVPALMAAATFVLFYITVSLDVLIGGDFVRSTSWLFHNTPDSARLIFSTIASAVMTVIGVVFSLTMVVLTLTSQQYGPLIVTNFMRDRGNQISLGTFTATFIYSLLILRTIRGSLTEGFFIPHISSLVGFLLALASLAILIYFIHHVSMSIQSTQILADIRSQLLDTIGDVFPIQIGEDVQQARIDHPKEHVPENFDDQSQSIRFPESGYIDYIDSEALFALTLEHDVLLEVKYRPGDFITARSILGRAYPLEHVTPEVVRAIQAAYIVGDRRTPAQDVEFLIDQLASIAVRALSPGINDPFTAQMCLDRLGEGLCKLGSRRLPSAYRFDHDGRLRVIASSITFETTLYRAFDEIRHYGGRDLKVTIHLLDVLATISECVIDEYRDVLPPYAEAIWRACRSGLTEDLDLRRLDTAYYETQRALKAD
ncbi:MAG: DUF2254 domain-containing protein [Anaerolinea sp.]|nr:DUF2254 domain-containing protein [Anaerolinea sp.]